MAKKKTTTTKSKTRDLKPRKPVKGGVRRRVEDPCQGGEILRKG
jgi:hypothetical protein